MVKNVGSKVKFRRLVKNKGCLEIASHPEKNQPGWVHGEVNMSHSGYKPRVLLLDQHNSH